MLVRLVQLSSVQIRGLVGQFNDIITDYAVKELAALPGKAQVWAVGERVYSRLADADLPLIGLFTVPNSVKAITPLIGQILIEYEKLRSQDEDVLNSTSFTTVTNPEPLTNQLVSGCCPWTKPGNVIWPNFPGQPRTCCLK